VDVVQNPAAVLVALFEEDEEARVLLTVRSSRLRSHRGEVAFPGGRLDPGESIDAGALREAFEEVGLDPDQVTIIGHLSALPTVSSNTLMTPVVATLPGRPSTRAAPDEVSRIFDVALAELVADGVFREEWWAIPERPGADGAPGGEFPVPPPGSSPSWSASYSAWSCPWRSERDGVAGWGHRPAAVHRRSGPVQP
jgi:8-oxo-dGTP pyrophosphatase MutT (NUDIX family)